MRNDQGLLSIQLLLLILLGSTGLVILSGLQLSTRLQEDLESLCRLESSKTLSAVAQDMTELLSYNEEAKRLRQALKLARLGKVVGAVHGEVAIRALQMALDIKQRALITHAQIELLQFSQITPINLQKTLSAMQFDYLEFARFSVMNAFSPIKILAVYPDRFPDIAPVYKLKKSFTEEQAVSLSWKTRMQNDGHWSSKWIKINHTYQQSCRLSLKKSFSRFQVVLLKDKF